MGTINEIKSISVYMHIYICVNFYNLFFQLYTETSLSCIKNVCQWQNMMAKYNYTLWSIIIYNNQSAKSTLLCTYQHAAACVRTKIWHNKVIFQLSSLLNNGQVKINGKKSQGIFEANFLTININLRPFKCWQSL